MPIIQSNPGWASALAGLFGVAGGYFQGQEQQWQRQIEADKQRQQAALVQAQIENWNGLARERRVKTAAEMGSLGRDKDTGELLPPPVSQATAPGPAPASETEDLPTKLPGTALPSSISAMPAPNPAAIGTGVGAAVAAKAGAIPTYEPSSVVVSHQGKPTVVKTTTLPQLARPSPAKPPVQAWKLPGAPGPGQPYQGSVPPSIMSQLGPIDPKSFAPAPGFYGQPLRTHADELEAKATALEAGAQPYTDAGRDKDPRALSYVAAAKEARAQALRARADADKADERGQAWETGLWNRYSGMASIISMSQKDQDLVRYHIAQIGAELARNNITLYDANKRFEGVMAGVGAQYAGIAQRANATELEHGDRVTVHRDNMKNADRNFGQRVHEFNTIHPPGMDGGKPLSDKDMAAAFRAQQHNLANNGDIMPSTAMANEVMRTYTFNDAATRQKMEQTGLMPNGTPIEGTVLKYMRHLGLGLPPYAGKPYGTPAAPPTKDAVAGAKGTVSLAAAMQHPGNAGKSRAQVEADIKAQGFSVGP